MTIRLVRMQPTRIDRLSVDGHTSLKRVDVELRPLNVLIGANGSGKTNFVRVLELLGRIADGELQLYVELVGGAPALVRQPRSSESISIRLSAGDSTYWVTLQQTADDRLVIVDERFERLGMSTDELAVHQRGTRESALVSSDSDETGIPRLLRGCRVHHFSDTGASAAVKAAGPTADNIALHADARNLAAILLALRDNDRRTYDQIVAAVRMVAPYFRDFVLRPESKDRVRLRWRQSDSETIFSAHQMSDGTLRFVCLATLLLQSQLPGIVVLDEPELGLHPFAIKQVTEMIRAASTASQVVVATQSVTLLDQLALGDIIVVEREGGATALSRPDPARLRDWLDEYSLGELWQKNLIGGRPRREAV
jgi:predicted ATPase